MVKRKIQKQSRIHCIGGVRQSREKLCSWLKDDKNLKIWKEKSVRVNENKNGRGARTRQSSRIVCAQYK